MNIFQIYPSDDMAVALTHLKAGQVLELNKLAGEAAPGARQPANGWATANRLLEPTGDVVSDARGKTHFPSDCPGTLIRVG